MANEFDIPNSENAAALQNLLGATNELENPISRNAKILHNILGEQHEIEAPVGNIGKLLLQLKDAMPSGEIEITENGEYDVTAYETANVNVAGEAADGSLARPFYDILEIVIAESGVIVS